MLCSQPCFPLSCRVGSDETDRRAATFVCCRAMRVDCGYQMRAYSSRNKIHRIITTAHFTLSDRKSNAQVAARGRSASTETAKPGERDRGRWGCRGIRDRRRGRPRRCVSAFPVEFCCVGDAMLGVVVVVLAGLRGGASAFLGFCSRILADRAAAGAFAHGASFPFPIGLCSHGNGGRRR